jgi:DNA-binding XRE family transcriptional regulator
MNAPQQPDRSAHKTDLRSSMQALRDQAAEIEIEMLDRLTPDLDELVDAGMVEEPVPQALVWQLTPLIGELKQRRETLGLTITEVARKAELTRTVVSRLENGWSLNPTLDTLYRYALALDATIRLEMEPLDASS